MSICPKHSFNKWRWGGNPDDVDRISGLSNRDIHYIKKSWRVVNADPVGNGFLIFSRFFEADYDAQGHFSMIATLSKEEIVKNVAFKAHIINVMSNLNCVVDHLQNPGVVVAIMHRLGRSHKSHQIQEKLFWEFKDVLVNILKNDLKLSQPTIEAWKKLIDFSYKHLFTTLH